MLGLANQIQIFKDTTVYHPDYVLKVTTVETVHALPPPTPDLPLVDSNPLLLNLEVVIVAFLLLALPILIYLAYRYGKKMGRMEHRPIPMYEVDGFIRRFSQESTSDYSFPADVADSRNSSAINSPVFLRSPLRQASLMKEDDNSSPPTSDINKRELLEQIENEKMENLSLSDQISYKTSPPYDLVSVVKKAKSDSIDNFTLMYAYSDGSELEDQKEFGDDFFDEKVQLHSQDGQVLKKKVKYGVSIKNQGTHLEKTEVKELRTIYDPQSDAPEKKAAVMKETYQNSPIHNKLFFNQKKSSGDKTQEKLAICADENEKFESPVSTTTGKVEKKTSEAIVAQKETTLKEDKARISIEAAKIETIVEKYGVPDETGKFAKIFKDVEWIGEGSFGEVSKVVHRLDGKIYAVKKVKVKLGRFEELKKESKVFREVFAMTDLHHPNIVRYSTCWVEIEWEKDTDTKEKFEKSWGGDPLNLGDISENEISEEEISMESEPIEHSKTSDLGFEWDVSEKEKTRQKDQKKKDKIKETLKRKTTDKIVTGRKRKNSNLFVKTLSKSFIEEEIDELSRNSSLSKVESLSEVPGCKLCLYIQMEYCAGQSLKYYLENPKRQIVRDRVLEMFKKLLEGVNAIHSRGILHRDLKPANIFLDCSENVKIGDFGLASLGKFDEQVEGVTPKELVARRSRKLHSLRVGTPMYTSPEQESGGHYDQKTDIYSLGLIFYEMLVNFATNHERYEDFGRIRKEHQLPGPFQQRFPAESGIIIRMTSTSPKNRPTAEQLMAEVDSLLFEIKKQK